MGVDTACKNCVFAEWKGYTQTGCELGIIKNARRAGVEVKECYDEEKEFYVISNRLCSFCRPVEWAQRRGLEKGFYAAAKSEINLRFSAVVVVDKEDNIKDIKKTVNSLEKQSLKPQTVVVIIHRNHPTVKIEKLNEFMMKKRFNYWKVQGLLDNSKINRLAVDMVLSFKVQPYASVFRAGNHITKKFFETISKNVNEKFFQFAMITNEEDKKDPETLHGLVIPYPVWMNYRTISKLEEKLKEDKCQEIFQVKKIIKTFQ